MKSPIEKFTKEIEQMHPMYAMYLFQRLRADLETVREHLPNIFEEDRKNTENNEISLFSPHFYIQYGNMVADILKDVCEYEIEPFVEPVIEDK